MSDWTPTEEELEALADEAEAGYCTAQVTGELSTRCFHPMPCPDHPEGGR